MILAKKNGWLIAVLLVRKTRCGAHVQPIDNDRTTFVSLRDANSKLCEDVAEAMAFVHS